MLATAKTNERERVRLQEDAEKQAEVIISLKNELEKEGNKNYTAVCALQEERNQWKGKHALLQEEFERCESIYCRLEEENKVARTEREALVETVKAEREKIEQLGRESALLRQEKSELELMKDELVESLDAEVEQRRALDASVLALKA